MNPILNPPSHNGAKPDTRRGIALVIVLGLMSMLIIMGFAFATAMRTEHRAAQLATEQTASMEIVYYALAEALNHIEADATASGWFAPDWGNFALHTGNHPSTDKASWGPAPPNGTCNLLSWYGPWFVPGSILNRARSETGNVQWVRVRSPVDHKIVGQYAYMIVDCSGFIDANGNYETNPLLALARSRGPGTNVTEMVLTNSLLTELRRGSETNLHAGRMGINRAKPFSRAETLPDLRTVGYSMYPNASSLGSEAGSISPMTQNSIARSFFTYSAYPAGFYSNNQAAAQTDLLGDGAEMAAKHARLSAASRASGLPAAEADVFARNIIDFVDSDFVPGGLMGGGDSSGPNCDSICTEPVPMLNEFEIALRYPPFGSAPTRAINILTRAELFFPFLFTSNALVNPMQPLQFRVRMSLEGGTFDQPSRDYEKTITIPQASMAWVTTALNPAPAGQFILPHTLPGGQMLWAITGPSSNAVAPTAIILKEMAVLDSTGRYLDRIDFGAAGRRLETGPDGETAFFPNDMSQATSYFTLWAVNDPRCNWRFSNSFLPADASQWKVLYRMRPTGASEIATRNTLGRMNLHPPGPTDTAYTPHSAITPPVAVTGERNEWAMYVKNGPFESVGELGYLLCLHQRPWQTISLLGNYHPATNLVFTVLDHFTIATNRVRHGLVSMNSQWSNVLATAFLNCPLELAPGIRQYGMPAASVVVSRAESLLIGENIIQRRDALQPLGFRNLSDIRYTSLFDPALIMPRLTSWMAREGLVRNTCGLLGVRNNAFSVLLIGQAQRQFVNPERGVTETRTLAAQRAMATIWRDPYFSPDPHTTTLRHRMFVRNLRWYDEWEGGVDDYNPGADAF